VLRNVADQDNRIERIECHDALGTTVTSLTNSLPRSLIHMVRIEATRHSDRASAHRPAAA
jgi:hypothetical protein